MSLQNAHQQEPRTPWRSLTEILQTDFKVAADKIAEANEARQTSGRRLGETLVTMKVIPPETLCKALAAQRGLPFLDTLSDYATDAELLQT